MNPLLPPTILARTELIELFHVLAADLSLWLKSQLLRHSGKNWWQTHVVSVLRSQDQLRIADGEWKELEDLDLGVVGVTKTAHSSVFVSPEEAKHLTDQSRTTGWAVTSKDKHGRMSWKLLPKSQ